MLSNKDKYELYNPKKRFSQNFLVDENISRKIVNFLEISDNDFIIEIGPGKGALTKYIHSLTKNYLAVEIDEDSFYELKQKNYNVIKADILDFDFKKISKEQNNLSIKIIGNIPYNITSHILFKLLDNAPYLTNSVIMIQKEVGQRIIAKKGTKDYGILSVQFQSLTDVKIVYNIPPTAFFPKPNVDSCILKTTYNTKGKDIKNISLFKDLVRSAFSRRRKTMKNSLKIFFDDKKINSEEINFDFSRRAESLTIDEFQQLYTQIFNLLS